jgi:hypothetical protein
MHEATSVLVIDEQLGTATPGREATAALAIVEQAVTTAPATRHPARIRVWELSHGGLENP